VLEGAGTRRSVPLDGFYVDLFETVMRHDEILTTIVVPPPPEAARFTYIKFLPRTVDDFATVSAAVRLQLAADGTVEDLRIALGGAHSVPFRATSAEAALRGRRPDPAAIDDAAALARDAAEPFPDVRGSAAYKREMVRVWVARALTFWRNRPDMPDNRNLAPPELIGRAEDPVGGGAKVRGAALFAGDREMPGMLWARFLGSTRPHARIRAVDAGRAREMPGVRAVLTGRDAEGILLGRRLQDQPVICWDTVRFVGDRLAAVAADTPEQAAAALDEIDVEFEDLPAVTDARSALEAGAPILHPAASAYRYIGGERPPVDHPNLQSATRLARGEQDIEAVFASAAHVFEDRFTTPRQHHGAVEPHATLVWIDPDQTVRIVSTNKDPFALRTQIALTFGLDPSRIVIESSLIGGDFGGKGYSPDEHACYLLARATGRPIKAVAPHAEEIAAVNTRHAADITSGRRSMPTGICSPTRARCCLTEVRTRPRRGARTS
jgi:hypothetical protein